MSPNDREIPAISFQVQLAGAIHTTSFSFVVDTEEEARAWERAFWEAVGELDPDD